MTDAAGSTLHNGDGRELVLGPLIKSGGAGSVYRLRDTTSQVAKLYHPGADLRMYERRIAAMIELQPQMPGLVQDGTSYVQLAWPEAPLHGAHGRFVGYLMPVVDIDATDELELVLQERQARRLNLPTGLGAKVTLAANLCAVIAALHRQRHYIVDLKPVNLRFYRRSLYMALLDCDGFSIQGHGERFEAPNYTLDYLAPEFHLRELTAAGEAQQDRFALAVVVFQLLNFGIHPFTGRPQGGQVPTDIPSRIAGRWYAHGLKANASLLPTVSSGHGAMPIELRLLFDRAFDCTPSGSGGSMRPSADEWSDLLRGYAQRAEGKLVACGRDHAHQHFTGHACAACERVRALADARAAAARRPPRARAVARPSPFAIALQGAKPTAPAGFGSSQIPPHVLARLNQAWANRAPAAPPPPPTPGWPSTPMSTPPVPARRPANWSAPTPTLLSRIAPRGVRAVAAVLAAAVMLSLLAYGAFGNRGAAQGDAPEAIAAAGQAPESDITAVGVPQPPPDELDEQSREIDVLSAALIEGNDSAVVQSLTALRSRAQARQEQWQRNLEQARSAGIELPTSDAFAEAVVAQRGSGWIALDQGDRETAQARFADALWADAGDADAWLGYGLSTPSTRDAIGAVTIALLSYPDVATARASRDEFLPLAARGDARRQHELENVFVVAAPFAERQRQRLPPDLVRLSEPFAWDGP